jgi:UDP-N-acetylglucosamine 2-epimerase (non-hydrolysing)
LNAAEFVVTDGGSNQEECFFLGKACLILRRESERREGLGENAILSMKDFSVIDRFLADPSQWNRDGIASEIHPSRTIAEHLLGQPPA